MFGRILFIAAFLHASQAAAADTDLSRWSRQPADWQAVKLADGKAVLAAEAWSFLLAAPELGAAEIKANITILEPAKQLHFFGASWSAWPDPTFGDGGFEAGMLLRGGTTSGYRVQLSHKYQCVALVKFPDGGYVRVVPFPVKLMQPHAVAVRTDGVHIVVRVDGQERIRYHDAFSPIDKGRFGVGVSSAAKVAFSDVDVKAVEPTAAQTPAPQHKPSFAVRPFLGNRQWVFDGDEPILQLHHEGDPSCFAKLKPGYKPQLTFDSHWGIENQGAFPDGVNKWTNPTVRGGGESLQASWSARQVQGKFTTKSTLTVGFDSARGVYTYDVASELEMLPGEPFHFRYGFDFEHHTPLDPFRWQYLVAKRHGGELYHRPVYPIDPGPQHDLETYHGLRLWYGRHGEQMHIAPAVEYAIDPDWNRSGKQLDKRRQLNTAVCAAFYDTGVSFEPDTLGPGSKIRVKYRYTGYPAEEAAALFKQSKLYDSPNLDPHHHYIFADEWPKLTFSKFEPMSKSWIYGRTPFMTGHNQRPTYELETNCGAGSGFAMKLGPASFAKAHLPIGASLAKGRYVVSMLAKAVNVHGPGGYIDLEATRKKANQKLAVAKHFLGNGSFDWQRQAFVFDVLEDADALSLSLGNAGTGAMLVTDVEFRRLDDGAPIPSGVLPQANAQPARFDAAPPGSIADYRMQEGTGFHVFNHAGGEHLQLANLDWVIDEGRPALRFADNVSGTKQFRRDGGLARNYFSHPGYAGRDTLPIALSGHHGGGSAIKGLTLAAWIKPAAAMGRGEHGGRGDVIGYGARRFVLSLHGQKAPYQLAARINVNDVITSTATLDAERWQHVALTAVPLDGQWSVRLYVDGKAVGAGTTKQFPASSVIVPSLILGAEIFYFHDAYYRGLIGRTLVFDRALPASEILELAK